jgi:hypothetical protein
MSLQPSTSCATIPSLRHEHFPRREQDIEEAAEHDVLCGLAGDSEVYLFADVE